MVVYVIETPAEHTVEVILLTSCVIFPVIGGVVWCLPIWKKLSSLAGLITVMLAACGSLAAIMIASAFVFAGHRWYHAPIGALMLAQSIVVCVVFFNKLHKTTF